MGELTTTKPSPIGQWLDRIDATRAELISAATEGNRVAAAFAMAEARVELIESLKDEGIRARLLRMTSPDVCMVELANNPTEDDRIKVCAIAILSGFTPGDDQFAIFGGRGGGKLYTKEKGFRTLFAHLGIVPELRVGHPEYVKFGTGEKRIWKVGGSASCTYQGKEYKVEFSGSELIGIPGHDSDNVDAIKAKARRRILQQLWATVSPILNETQAEDDTEVVQTKPQAIESSAPMVTQDQPPAEPDPLPFDQQIEAATKSRELDTIARAIVAAKLSPEETEWYKGMVKEARKRLEEKTKA